jgi:hypothetical protein
VAEGFLSVARDFSRTPGARYQSEGDFSGELFRKELLVPAVRRAILEKRKLTVDLDGTAGYATSFLEEAFGGLIRREGVSAADLKGILVFKSHEEDYLVDDVWNYIEEARPE